MKRPLPLTILLAVGIMLGCNRNNETEDMLPGNKPRSGKMPAGDALMKLGEYEPSPYTLQNINAACEELGLPEKQATHRYIRLDPADAEEYAALNEREDWELWEFPMDYQVAEDGYMYLERPGEADAVQPLYAVVPLGFDLTGVNHTVLEELYFPDEEKEGNLEDRAYALRGKSPDTWDDPGMEPKSHAAAVKPKGYLRVQDDWLGNLPVAKIKVRAKKGLKVNTVQTDVNGFFQMTKKFKGNVKFYIYCDNAYGNIRYLVNNNFLSLLQTYRGTLGAFPQSFYENFDYTIGSNHTNGVVATMFNNMHRTRQYCFALNVGYHGYKLRYWAHNGNFNVEASSAPMLKHMYTAPISALASGLAGIAMGTLAGAPGMPPGVGFGGATAVGLAPLLAVYIELVKPDIYITYNGGMAETSGFNATLFHEHGHAIHFNKAGGQVYWYPYVWSIVNNYMADPQAGDFYGNHGNSGYGRIALGEAWAEFIGYRFALEMYGYNRVIPTPWGQLPLFQEANERPVPDITDLGPYDLWIPYGIFHDLVDYKNTGVPTEWPMGSGILISIEDTVPVDIIGGYGGLGPNGNNFSRFYNTLGPTIDHPGKFREKFQQLYLNPSDATNYNTLWNWYGY